MLHLQWTNYKQVDDRCCIYNGQITNMLMIDVASFIQSKHGTNITSL